MIRILILFIFLSVSGNLYGQAADAAADKADDTAALTDDKTETRCDSSFNEFLRSIKVLKIEPKAEEYSKYKTECVRSFQDSQDYAFYSTYWSNAKIEAAERIAEEINSKFEDLAKQCVQKRDVAAECCGNPGSCFKDPDGESKEGEGKFAEILSMGLSATLNFASSSISGQCAKLGSVATLMTGINGYLSMQCSKHVGVCKKTCSEQIESAKAEEICHNKRCDKQIAAFETLVDDCKTFDNQAARLASQAVASQVSAKMAGECKKLAQEGSGVNSQDAFANPDCSSPSAATSPFCQAKCSKIGAQGDPDCAGFFSQNGEINRPGFTSGEAGSGNGAGRFDNLLDEEEAAQQANLEDVAANANKSTGGNGGGGGGGLGGGGGGGGYDGGGGGGGYGDDGYDTGILKGTQSGNGYSLSGGSLLSGSRGGFSGYGGSSGRAITDKGKKMNLKDFLPGGKNNKPLALRGLASIAKDISPPHADIFKKVTDRFYQVCLRNALYDCATLKKNGYGN